MGEQRKRLTGEEKVALLRRHLLEKVPVSTLCEEAGVSVNVFYRWQQELFENGALAFERRSDVREKRLEERNAALEAKLAKKDEVMAELLMEHVALKKSLGEA
jgi:transposase-like protein